MNWCSTTSIDASSCWSLLQNIDPPAIQLSSLQKGFYHQKILAKSLWTHHPLFYRTQISVCSLVGNCLSSSQTSVLKLVTNFMVRPGSIITGWVWEQIYQFVNQTHLHDIDQNQTYQGTSSKCNLNNHIDHQGIHHHHQILTNSL